VESYAEVNRRTWDERAPAHAASPGYFRDRFLDDPSFLSYVVQFDVPRLGDVSGLRGVHLQCHIGTDTLSLARLGAAMTGVDLSPASLAEARRLAADTGASVEYVESELYDAVAALGGRTFDFVYTGIGALCWLPSVSRWASVVVSLLEPGGRLFMREGHPVLWALSYTREDGLLVLDYPYFETVEAVVEESDGTYVETDVTFTETQTQTWNHGLGEIVTALLSNGMELTQLVEHDSVPWQPLPGQMVADGAKEWRMAAHPERLPLSYTLQAVKRRS
jgi:SAM-dependent methyltransferase